MKHAKHPLVVVAGAVLLLLAIRAGVASWVSSGMQSPERQQFFHFLWVETAVDLVVWIAAGGVIAWVVLRAARMERDRRRLEHLADVALLSGGLAHEIRNHLNALGTYISLLRKSAGQDSGELLQRITKLEQATTALDELVNDFLTLTRPLKDKLERVDLVELAEEVAEFLSLDLEQSSVEVHVEADRGVPPVVGDRGKLRRVILNLLVNARQAMPRGGKISVRVRSSDSQVALDIADTGCGIPPEEQPRVFEAFFSTKSEGTGLGLAVVKRTIEDLGGRISFESELGRGTTFRVALPAAAQYQTTMRRLGRDSSEPVGRPAESRD